MLPGSLLLDPVKEERICLGLSRFARWATLRRIAPDEVCGAIIDAFIAELDDFHPGQERGRDRRRSVANAWNSAKQCSRRVVASSRFTCPRTPPAPTRFPWEELPASFQDEVARYRTWGIRARPARRGRKGEVRWHRLR